MYDPISQPLLILTMILVSSAAHSGQEVDVLLVQARVTNSCAVTASLPTATISQSDFSNTTTRSRYIEALKTAIDVQCSQGTSYSLSVRNRSEILSAFGDDTTIQCLNWAAGGSSPVEVTAGTSTGEAQKDTAEFAVNAADRRQDCTDDIAVVISF